MAARLTQLRTSAVSAGYAVSLAPATPALKEVDRLAARANLSVQRVLNLLGTSGNTLSQDAADPREESLLEGALSVSAGSLR